MSSVIKRKSKVMAVVLAITMFCLAGCGEVSAAKQNKLDTEKATETLLTNQATPTDIEFSLERFNLIRRAYWVNGLWEKANAVPCPVERPIGYIACIDNGVVIYTGSVDGKVSSLNSYLSPDSEYYEYGGSTYYNEWLADVDGSYGENTNGVFWFTVDGHYKEWTGKYLYGDEPFDIDDPVLTIKVTE